jgi:hypothetical protein
VAIFVAKLQEMQQLINWVSDIILSPTKSLVTTLGTAATGTLIDLKITLLQVPTVDGTEVWLRNGAWIMSMVVGLCSLINFIEKQYDKYKKKKDDSEDIQS